MRFQPEPDSVIERVAAEVGATPTLTRSVVEDIRHLIDRLVADDVSVLVWPLMFRRSGEPVCPAIVDRFEDDDWRNGEGLKTLPPDQFARELGLPVEIVNDFPVAFGMHLLHELFEWRGDDWTDPVGDALVDIFYSWRRTYEFAGDRLNRPYLFSHVGLEARFEDWLVGDLETLRSAGYPVDLVKRQPRFRNGRRGDLLCRVVADEPPLRSGDWLIIENKATAVGLPAYEQLAEYVTMVGQEWSAGGEQVFGLLIADGTTVALQEKLRASGFGYLSLTELGYRDRLYRRRSLSTEADVSIGTVLHPAPEPVPGGEEN